MRSTFGLQQNLPCLKNCYYLKICAILFCMVQSLVSGNQQPQIQLCNYITFLFALSQKVSLFLFWKSISLMQNQTHQIRPSKHTAQILYLPFHTSIIFGFCFIYLLIYLFKALCSIV